MHFFDVFQDERCSTIYGEIDDFVTTLLKDYNAFLRNNQLLYRDKDIFDSVWGTVKLAPAEVFLIDSPLIQRLKSIKQLGCAYQVYCNADYSRFAHTIGVLEASKRMADIIKEDQKLQTGKDRKFNFIDVVRFAAIMHDSGHMFFSHVSELFFKNNERFPRKKEVRAALGYFSEIISDRAALHEMFSVMIVNSREFYEFLTIVYFDREWSEEERKTIIDYISGLIVGVAVDKKILPFSRIIKGTIDADRIDYLARDSYTTKVPLGVDLARLINKISIIDRGEFNPSQVWNDDSIGPYYTMAIQNSAQRLVWQLSMTRTILYQNIYFHHKKLTAESILSKALEYIFSLLSEEQLSFTYIASLTDSVFSEYFSDILISDEKKLDPNFAKAQALINSLKNRSFYKRVASFSQETVDIKGNTEYELFKMHVIENPFSKRYEKFVAELNNSYAQIYELLRKPLPSEHSDFMFVQASWIWEAEEGIPIDLGDGRFAWSTEIFKDTPIIGEENKQKQYYLLSDRYDRDVVFLALEKFLHCQKDIKLNNASYSCAKLTASILNPTRKILLEKGFYDRCLELIPDAVFRSMFDSATYNSIINKYRNYSGADDAIVTDDTLLSFLRQFLYAKCSYFEMKILLDGILRLLNGATFINRTYFTENMTTLMDKISQSDFDEFYIVKLGGLFDSSNRLVWFFNEIELNQKYKFSNSVSDAIKSSAGENACICFFDDGAYSGNQVISVFQELMGIPLENRKTDESHASELSEEEKDSFIKANITLAYICFNSSSQEYIFDELNKLGISNVTIKYHKDLHIKVFDENTNIFANSEQRKLVREKLSEIGYQVIKSQGRSDRWDEDRMREASLGYNDAQQMVIFDVNVPTYTILPFWGNGCYNGNNWRGLFQRTDNSKKSKMV